MQVPWTKLKSEPIVITLDCVEIHVETCEQLRNIVPTTKPSYTSGRYGFAEQTLDSITIIVNSVNIHLKSPAFEATLDVSSNLPISDLLSEFREFVSPMELFIGCCFCYSNILAKIVQRSRNLFVFECRFPLRAKCQAAFSPDFSSKGSSLIRERPIGRKGTCGNVDLRIARRMNYFCSNKSNGKRCVSKLRFVRGGSQRAHRTDHPEFPRVHLIS